MNIAPLVLLSLSSPLYAGEKAIIKNSLCCDKVQVAQHSELMRVHLSFAGPHL
jgi:hypothetical protein